MKNRSVGALIFACVIFTSAVWVPVTRWLAWEEDYGQAELLVKTVWPMAHELKRFSDGRGRLPNSLDELARFSTDLDFTSLRAYPHEFSCRGKWRFILRVNSRFAFGIDEQFTPTWAQPVSVFGAPVDPQ